MQEGKIYNAVGLNRKDVLKVKKLSGNKVLIMVDTNNGAEINEVCYLDNDNTFWAWVQYYKVLE